MTETLTKPTKAVVAFFVAGTGALAVALTDNAMTWGEGAVVLATAVAAAGAVYGVTNKPVVENRDPHSPEDLV
jgi:hypothetical protein